MDQAADFKRQTIKRFGLFGAISLFVLVVLGFSWSEERWVGKTMGTSYSIHVFIPGYLNRGDVPHFEQLKQLAQDQLALVNESMSTYIADSQISRLNKRSVSSECVPVSPLFLDTFNIARDLSKITEGAFDVTAGPLVDIWGFGATDGLMLDWIPPSSQQIQQALSKVGLDKIEAGANCLKKRADVALDFSGIAKGYGVDVIAKAFKERGVHHFLIEIGGEVFASGVKKPIRPWMDEHPWKLALETPGKNFTASIDPFPLTDLGVATSGDYRNYLEHEGVQYSHLIDPRSGQAVRHKERQSRLRSVSVFDTSVARADGLATGLLVSGVTKAQQIATAEDLNVVLFIESWSEAKEAFEHQVWISPLQKLAFKREIQ